MKVESTKNNDRLAMRLHVVHLRVNDAETNKPTPCRIRVSDPGGNEYAPLGRPLQFSCNRGEDVGGHCRIAGERWFSIDGQCEIALPPGELRVQVRKGIEYSPVDQVVDQPAGKMAIRLSIQGHGLVGKLNQVTMDMRCHHLTPHAAVLDAAAEGLDYVQLLAEPLTKLGDDGNNYTSVPNLLAFSGQKSCLEQVGAKVIVNTHNRHPMLGSLAMLHSHRVVNPLLFGAPDNCDDWSLRDWAGQCHRKGGLVVWTEPFVENKPFAGEALALAILGEVDAFELSPDHLPSSLRGWYQLLNAGVQLPIVGASGRLANDRPLGTLQTISFRDDGPWAEQIKLSSSVTNGPIVTLARDSNRFLYCAISAFPFGRLELVSNGHVVQHIECRCIETSPQHYVATGELEIKSGGWVAARAANQTTSPLSNLPMFGHTSAKWIDEPVATPQSVDLLLSHLDRARDWVENHGRFEQPKFKKQLLDTFDEAKAKLMSGNRS